MQFATFTLANHKMTLVKVEWFERWFYLNQKTQGIRLFCLFTIKLSY